MKNTTIEIYDVYIAIDTNGDCLGEADKFKDIFRLYGHENIGAVVHCNDIYINNEYVKSINNECVWARGDEI